MKNILGKKEDLELFNADGVRVYEFEIDLRGCCYEYTYDSNGNELTFKDSLGYWGERTYDDNGNQLTYKDSDGYWNERTYDDNGNQLTFKNSRGVTKGFDKEYTMDELIEKIGHNFKIKK
jgi:hypothetical protein